MVIPTFPTCSDGSSAAANYAKYGVFCRECATPTGDSVLTDADLDAVFEGVPLLGVRLNAHGVGVPKSGAGAWFITGGSGKQGPDVAPGDAIAYWDYAANKVSKVWFPFDTFTDASRVVTGLTLGPDDQPWFVGGLRDDGEPWHSGTLDRLNTKLEGPPQVSHSWPLPANFVPMDVAVADTGWIAVLGFDKDKTKAGRVLAMHGFLGSWQQVGSLTFETHALTWQGVLNEHLGGSIAYNPVTETFTVVNALGVGLRLYVESGALTSDLESLPTWAGSVHGVPAGQRLFDHDYSAEGLLALSTRSANPTNFQGHVALVGRQVGSNQAKLLAISAAGMVGGIGIRSAASLLVPGRRQATSTYVAERDLTPKRLHRAFYNCFGVEGVS